VVFTITGEGFFAATLQINATAEIDAAGEGGSVDFCYMAVGADGTIYETTTGTATLARMPIQPLDAAETPMAVIPTWDPTEGEDDDHAAEATPAA